MSDSHHAATADSEMHPLVSPTLMWLEGVSPGSAASNHLHGTRLRLAQANIYPAVEISADTRKTGRLNRLFQIIALSARVLGAPRNSEVLLARWHPLILPSALWWRLIRRGRIVFLVQGVLDDLYAMNPWTRRIPLIAWASKNSLRLAHGVAAPTEGIKTWLREFARISPDLVEVIPNGVNLQPERQITTQSARLAAGVPYAVFLGHLAPWQGLNNLLIAAASADWPGGLDLVIIGGGPELDLARAASEAHKHIHALGPLSRDQAQEVLANAAISFAVRTRGPESDRGVSPFKLLEAGALGIPTVVTDIPGQTEMANALGGSVIVEPDSPIAIAQATRSLINDETLRSRLAHEVQRNVVTFEWEARANQLADVLHLATRRARR